MKMIILTFTIFVRIKHHEMCKKAGTEAEKLQSTGVGQKMCLDFKYLQKT